jgi:hypothetical protein
MWEDEIKRWIKKNCESKIWKKGERKKGCEWDEWLNIWRK